MFLGAYLKKAGHEPEILDFLLNKFNENLLMEKAAQADLIGISAVTPLVASAIKLVNLIKERFPKKIVVLGGPHPTLLPKETLESCKNIDYIVKGEGEERLVWLLEYLAGKRKKENLDGLAFSESGEIVDLPQRSHLENLDSMLFPARDLVSIKKYSKFIESRKKPATTIITSRGCPFDCTYCSKPIFGRLCRERSPENILEEMELLKERYGIKEFIFYDDTFTLNRDRVAKLCRLLIDKKINVYWKCETRVNLVDEELLKLMKAAGCYLIGYGIESGSQRVLDVLKKGITRAEVIKAADITKKAGIEVLGYFMLGIPGEKEKEIEETIRFAKDLNIDYAQFSIATAYPGTELYQIAKKENKIPKDWQNSFYALGRAEKIISLCELDPDTLKKYLKKAYRSFYFRPSYLKRKLIQMNSPEVFWRYLRGLRTLLRV
jgi:radical SAM superfamily enzyme YgiQ (UPF0313 family)